MKKKQFILFIDKDAIAAFWVLVTAGAILTAGIMTLRAAANIAARAQYVVMRSPDIHPCPPGSTPELEQEMYESETKLIMQSIFNRGPHRLDDNKRCRKLVLDGAWQWLEDHILERENPIFDKEQLHQKIELDQSQFIVRDVPKENAVLTYMEGQLLRTGVIRETVFNEVWDVRAQFLWVTNPNLREKGRIPVVCKTLFIQQIAAGSTKKQIPATAPQGAPRTAQATPPLPNTGVSEVSAPPLSFTPATASSAPEVSASPTYPSDSSVPSRP